MDIIIDSGRQLSGNIVRCSYCKAYLNVDKLENCPNCHNPVCYKCGHCRCVLSEQRKIRKAIENWVAEG